MRRGHGAVSGAVSDVQPPRDVPSATRWSWRSSCTKNGRTPGAGAGFLSHARHAVHLYVLHGHRSAGYVGGVCGQGSQGEGHAAGALQWSRPEKRALVVEALEETGRTDLIGYDEKKCLIRPRKGPTASLRQSLKTGEAGAPAPPEKGGIRNRGRRGTPTAKQLVQKGKMSPRKRRPSPKTKREITTTERPALPHGGAGGGSLKKKWDVRKGDDKTFVGFYGMLDACDEKNLCCSGF